MKFTCTQENLSRGLNFAQAISNQATALPILKNILINAKNGAITIKATDLEIGITALIRGKIEQEGELTVDSKILTSFVNLLPNDKVDVTSEKNIISIQSGSYKTKINGIPADDFPVIPEIPKNKGFSISCMEIKKALISILPSVSIDDTRPEINGVYIKVNKEEIILAGTDSYRLGEFTLALSPASYNGHFILPLKTAKEFIRTSSDDGQLMEFWIAENQLLASYNGTDIVSRLIDGEYPDYKQIIPSSHALRCIIPKDEFVKAIKISGIFAAVGSNSVTFEFKPKNTIIISSATAVGEEETKLSVPIEGGEPLKIIFDYRYLLDGLSSIDTDDIELLATSSSAPVVLKPIGSGEKKFIYIVMPIRQ